MARELARGFEFSPKGMSEKLGVSEPDFAPVLHALLEAGFIRPAEDEPGFFVLTIKGSALAQARFLKRIPRAKAERIISEVIERAVAINQRKDLLYFVDELATFGSFETDSETLGDVDFVLILSGRFPPKQLVQENLARARASGRSMRNYVDELYYGQNEVFRLLKARSPYISLHPPNDAEKLGVTPRVIFRREAK